MSTFNVLVYAKGLEHVKNNCDKMIITHGAANINDYAATVALKCAEASTTPAHFSIVANGSALKINRPLIQGMATATKDASADKQLAFLDTVNSKVLVIEDETSDQAITAGNPVDFNANSFGFNAPA